MNIFVISLTLIEQPIYALNFHSWYKCGCYPDTPLQKRRASLPRSC